MANDLAVLTRQRDDLLTHANDLAIANQEDANGAADVLRMVKTIEKAIHARLDPAVEAAHAAHKEAVALRNSFLDPVRHAETTVKTKLARWTSEQERIRMAEEARLREEARKAAEERALAEAKAAQDAGEPELAEAIIAAPPPPLPVVAIPKAQAQKGVSTRTAFRFRIVAPDMIPREYLVPDEQRIGGVVRSLGHDARIPGVEVYTEQVVSARAYA